MDFDTYLQEKGIAVGTKLPAAIAKQMHAQFLKDSSGSDFQPRTGMATNEATGDVTPYFMNSANSAQVLPEGRFKEGPVDKDGTQLVFDPSAGKYFPATNAATGMVVRPKAKSSGFTIGPNGQIIPAGMAEEEPSPPPDPGMTNSMAFQGVPARSAYETNMQTGVAAPALSGAMGAAPGISMTPVARATAATNAAGPAPALSTPDQVRAAYRQRVISKEQARALLQGGL
jgi:hypothetical protein